jgi:Carboxypeptidase regulatory-like domain
MRKRLNPLVLLVATLSLTTALPASPAIGTMAGTVLDARGKPVAGATVTMQTSDGSRPFATHTDAEGHFEFARYRTGQYDLRAYAKGMFSDWTKRISIRSGKTTEVTLRLPPAADESVVVPTK